ncbi:MAG: glycosyltransferase family 4 protein [Candidatus Omnitrophica bacterium]|nr:glycosyltransferase family 4 protein [Candidatus Omnitrophota bacterium]
MRVLFVIPHPIEAASGRLRVLQYLPWLHAQGIQCEVRPFMPPALYRLLYQPGRLPQKISMSAAAVIRRCLDVGRVAKADVVVVHREAWPLGTALLERLMARRSSAMVFDFDDAIYLPHASRVNAWANVFKRPGKISQVIAASTHVTAGNSVLAGYARRYNPKVSIIPTPVDTEAFHPRQARVDSSRLVIGWMGSHTTASYLQEIRRPLEQLLRAHPQVELRVVGAGHLPYRLPNLQEIPWTLESEQHELHRFDIGLMPMPDDPWTQGKCGFKALLYMSVGIPVVASPVGVNSAIIQDGVSGFLANDEQTWFDRLAQLIDDEALRRRMGRAGRAMVEQEYSVKAQAPRLIRVLREAHDGPRGDGVPLSEPVHAGASHAAA